MHASNWCDAARRPRRTGESYGFEGPKPWPDDSGAITLVAVAVLFVAFRKGWITRVWLALMALFYVAFAGLLVGLRL